MQFNTYQRKAREVSTHPLTGPRICVEYAALALAGEAGELANIVKKHWRATGETGALIPPGTLEQLREEAGDILWYVSFLADRLGLKLNDVAERNLEKLNARRNGL